ncbi:MAG TPA: hypothetical protein VMZ03_09150 [Chitinophagaceae bacterium]|nr:hypothetical protein [Chitinophagaceae bacterium]
MAIHLSITSLAQKGDELLVYAVKGKVSSVFNNQESPVKIGKVLPAGATIKTEKGASVTVLCSKGKAFSVTKEGSYPVSNWKDSCRVASNSVTANYFKYIWGQLYTYSPQYKEETRKKSEMAVVRGDEPTGSGTRKKPRIEFSPGMDTLNYDGNNFPLSWNGIFYTGKYIFTLYNAKGKLLYRDSTRYTYITTDDIKHLLNEGNTYRWTIGGKGIPASKKKVLQYVRAPKAADHLSKIQVPLDITEDSASVFFRIAYLLERSHYLAEAYTWYLKANDASDPEVELYRDQLIRFRNEFWIR